MVGRTDESPGTESKNKWGWTTPCESLVNLTREDYRVGVLIDPVTKVPRGGTVLVW